jgi:beta-glucanase (GH16 family)
MKVLSILKASAACLLLLSGSVSAQTYSNCNPLTASGCPPDSALGRSVSIDFTQGASDSFTAQGNPTYGSDGVQFTIAKSGDSPQLTSKWYIMFGRVDVVLKAAPGVGIVSSVVLQSDDLDEIDWEWLGADPQEVQSNYFGKGITGSYNRGAFHSDPGSQSGFQTYTVDWNANQIVWQINGATVRALEAANAEPNQYPQTPMQLKIGAWSGGDPSNSPGTIQWAGGPTNYANGPYSMYVKSVTVTDYSTGTQYKYGSNSGNWQDIIAVGGKVNPSGGGSSPASAASAAPPVTSTSTGQPIPFQGTHKDSSAVTTPTGYPWIPLSSGKASQSTVTYTNYPGLPSGWTVTSSGKVVPPSSAPARMLIDSVSLILPSANEHNRHRSQCPHHPQCHSRYCRSFYHRPSLMLLLLKASLVLLLLNSRLVLLLLKVRLEKFLRQQASANLTTVLDCICIL